MDDSIKYVVLTDNKYGGTVVRLCGRKHYIYRNGEWIRTGIMTHYFWDESPFYDLYKEITPEEAEQLIKQSLV